MTNEQYLETKLNELNEIKTTFGKVLEEKINAIARINVIFMCYSLQSMIINYYLNNY